MKSRPSLSARPQVGVVGIDAEPEKRQRRFGEDPEADREGELHRERGHQVRTDVPEHHLAVARAEGPGRRREILLPEAQVSPRTIRAKSST